MERISGYREPLTPRLALIVGRRGVVKLQRKRDRETERERKSKSIIKRVERERVREGRKRRKWVEAVRG
jgi:hypothetical protein